MKKLFALITIIIIVGFSVTGCGTNDEKQTSSSNVETNYNTEEVAGEIEDQEKKEETTNKEEQNDTEIKEDTEAVEHSGDAEKVLFSFFEAMTDQDVEKAREYVLYDDLDYPFLALEEGLDYYSENKPIDIIKVEELSEDMKMIYVNIDTPEKKIEYSFRTITLDILADIQHDGDGAKGPKYPCRSTSITYIDIHTIFFRNFNIMAPYLDTAG